jgi:hypothetical protein
VVGLDVVRQHLVRQHMVGLDVVRQHLVRQHMVRLDVVRQHLVRFILVRGQLVWSKLGRRQLVLSASAIWMLARSHDLVMIGQLTLIADSIRPMAST